MELREKDTRKVLAGLKICNSSNQKCGDCYLYDRDECDSCLLADAAEHIEELEKEVEYFSEKYNETCIELTKERESKWISVEDRLPKSEFVLCTDGKYCFVNIIPDMEDVLEDGVTHWMPLPEPPKPKEPTFKDMFLRAFPKARKDERFPICLVFPYMKDVLCKSSTCKKCWNQPYFEPKEEGAQE